MHRVLKSFLKDPINSYGPVAIFHETYLAVLLPFKLYEHIPQCILSPNRNVNVCCQKCYSGKERL